MSESNSAYVYHVRNAESAEDEHYVSLLSEELALEHGLPPEAILGQLTDGPDQFDHEHFLTNRRFLHFLHEFLARTAIECPGIIAEIQRQRDGFVYVLDGRTATTEGDVPTEDILAAIEIEGGAATKYRANPNYEVFTAAGVTSLEPWLHERWIAAIIAGPEPEPEPVPE